MSRFRHAVAVACLLSLPAGYVLAQDEAVSAPVPTAAEVKAMETELNRLYKETLAEVDARQRKIRERLAADPEVQAGYKKANEFRRAQDATLKASEELAAAREQESQDAKRFHTAVNTALGLDGDAAVLRDRRRQIDAELFELELEHRLTESRIDHHRRAIERSPSAALKQAERSEAILAAEQAKRDARTALGNTLTEEFKSNPEAFAEQQRLAAAREKYSALGEERGKVDAQMRDQRRAIERGDAPEVVETRKAYEASRHKTRAVSDEVGKPDRDAERAARHAAEARLRELIAADEDAVAAAKERAAVDQQIRELKDRIRVAQRAIAAREKADAAKPSD